MIASRVETTNNIICDLNELKLSSSFSPFFSQLKTRNFNHIKEETKFVHTVECLIRRSPEYKNWRNYVVNEFDAADCSITSESGEELTVEIHHHIPTLFTLVKCFIVRHISKNEEFTSFEIAEEVMEYHYCNKVGYVSIIKSLHEKHHNGFLQIPMNLVKGNYQAFLNEFQKFLDDDDLQSLQSKLRVNKCNCGWYKNAYASSNM